MYIVFPFSSNADFIVGQLHTGKCQSSTNNSQSFDLKRQSIISLTGQHLIFKLNITRDAETALKPDFSMLQYKT